MRSAGALRSSILACPQLTSQVVGRLFFLHSGFGQWLLDERWHHGLGAAPHEFRLLAVNAVEDCGHQLLTAAHPRRQVPGNEADRQLRCFDSRRPQQRQCARRHRDLARRQGVWRVHAFQWRFADLHERQPPQFGDDHRGDRLQRGHQRRAIVGAAVVRVDVDAQSLVARRRTDCRVMRLQGMIQRQNCAACPLRQGQHALILVGLRLALVLVRLPNECVAILFERIPPFETLGLEHVPRGQRGVGAARRAAGDISHFQGGLLEGRPMPAEFANEPRNVNSLHQLLRVRHHVRRHTSRQKRARDRPRGTLFSSHVIQLAKQLEGGLRGPQRPDGIHPRREFVPHGLEGDLAEVGVGDAKLRGSLIADQAEFLKNGQSLGSCLQRGLGSTSQEVRLRKP
mmetsp:Transcript_44071/g.122000  ORF Transcript_44071/g.122000 Transcript_44071/m.122000 type:complete len:398 (-) Transcript_44071:19-1212(-)